MKNRNRIKEIMTKFKLKPHPEGGYFSESYRSAEYISNKELPDRFNGSRNFMTHIFYMLIENDFSKFHKLAADELWHFYEGSQVILHLIDHIGDYKKILLGNDENSNYCIIVPRGVWFAAEIMNKQSFALVGCTISPGFEYSDIEFGNREILLEHYPEHIYIIKKFT